MTLPDDDLPLQAGGGDGTLLGMEHRLTRLEAGFEQVRKDLDEIKSDQKHILDHLSQMPTSDKLFGYTATVGALAFAIIGVFIGVLAYLQALPQP